MKRKFGCEKVWGFIGGYSIARQGSRYGIIDIEGRTIVDFCYEGIKLLPRARCSRFSVFNDSLPRFFEAKMGETSIVLLPGYTEFKISSPTALCWYSSFLLKVEDKEMCGVFNLHTRKFIKCQDGLSTVNLCKKLIELEFEDIISIKPIVGRETLKVKRDGKWGVTDEMYNIIVPIDYDAIDMDSDRHCFVALTDTKVAFFDRMGKKHAVFYKNNTLSSSECLQDKLYAEIEVRRNSIIINQLSFEKNQYSHLCLSEILNQMPSDKCLEFEFYRLISKNLAIIDCNTFQPTDLGWKVFDIISKYGFTPFPIFRPNPRGHNILFLRIKTYLAFRKQPEVECVEIFTQKIQKSIKKIQGDDDSLMIMLRERIRRFNYKELLDYFRAYNGDWTDGINFIQIPHYEGRRWDCVCIGMFSTKYARVLHTYIDSDLFYRLLEEVQPNISPDELLEFRKILFERV